MPHPQKILCVVGTRPEAIKMAPVIRALLARPDRFQLHLCSTGQHRAMLDQVLELFALRCDSELDVMQPNQNPAGVAALIIDRIGPVITRFQPDWMLVQGDTVTVTAAALAGIYHRVKVGHVEAGLRTDDRWLPYPEEINRRVASVLAERHFAATPWARDNLLREAVPASQILVTGNTVIDALHLALRLQPAASVEKMFSFGERRIVLVTMHRRENLGEPVLEVVGALKSLAQEHRDDLQIVFPVHLNPNVRKPVFEALSGEPNISLVEPLDYGTLVHVLARCHLVLTDSGGLQEEAPSLGKPVLVMREVTERPEAVKAGTVRLVGTNRQRIVTEMNKLLRDEQEYRAMSRAVNPYGDGKAALRIAASLAGEPVEEFTESAASR